jgi:hypothetical protein
VSANPPGYPPGYYAGPDDPLVSPDFAGWWSRSMRLLSVAWRPLLIVQLLWAVPLLVLTILGNVLPGDTTTTTDELGWKDLTPLLFIALPVLAAAFLIALIAELAMFDLLVRHVTGRPMSIRDALMTGLRRTPAMLGWGIIGGLLILVGAVFCLLPGVYFGLVLTILPAVVLLERGNAIGRSFQLFHANFGAAIARVGVICAVSIGFLIVENAFAGALGNGYLSEGPVSTTAGVVTAFLSVAFSIISGVVVAPLTLTAYADMRARREPFSTTYLTGGA